MEIIAKTKEGCLIQATKSEVEEILNAVMGAKPERLEIGQKIPAIDYATTIRKVRALSKNNYYKSLIIRIDDFVDEFNKIDKQLNALQKLVWDTIFTD